MDVEAALAEVAKATPRIVSVYLFGSVAEGRDHRESDVDVGVLLDWSAYPSSHDRFDLRLRLIEEMTGAVRRDADVVILNDAPPLLARTVIYRGRRIYCTDTEADHAFVRDTQLLAADIEPWLKRMRAIELEASRHR
jgi:predicted nucleotidyltransferase